MMRLASLIKFVKVEENSAVFFPSQRDEIKMKETNRRHLGNECKLDCVLR